MAIRPAFSLLLLMMMLLLAACGNGGDRPAPPRVETGAPTNESSSRLLVPVAIPMDMIRTAIEGALPTTLWQIDRKEPRCIAPARIKIGSARIPVTPKFSCRIVGDAKRGAIRLTGSGDELVLHLPVTLTVSAREVAAIFRETATASADVKVRVRLMLDEDWTPKAKVALDVNWKEPPGVDFLGQRIRLVDPDDPSLAGMLDGLERELEAELAKLDVRADVEKAWNEAHSVIALNDENPAVWMVVTPRELGFNGYSIRGRHAILNLDLRADTETFVQETQPVRPATSPLPALATLDRDQGFDLRIPVVASYDELVPMLGAALNKLGRNGFEVPVVGKVDVIFGQPVIYATAGGKLAIGLPMRAKEQRGGLETGGMMWMTARPVNQPGSQQIEVRELQLYGDVDSRTGDILVAIARAPAITHLLERELAQNFSGDFTRLISKIDESLAEKRIGAFILNMKIDEVLHGVVQPIGAGLYLLVEARGKAELAYRPMTAAEKATAEAEEAARKLAIKEGRIAA